jgi:hypothetical protein
MTNPKYLVNISYIDPYITGGSGATNAYTGLWETRPVYSTGIYLATMPEIRISATGSSYADALTALLSVATNAPDAAQGPAQY